MSMPIVIVKQSTSGFFFSNLWFDYVIMFMHDCIIFTVNSEVKVDDFHFPILKIMEPMQEVVWTNVR